MTRLAVVSGNAALPFALGSAGHEVVIVDDDHDVRWSEYGGAEVVVLDVDDLDASMMLVEDLAATSPHDVRVLLLAKSDPRWAAISEAPGDGVVVLPLPLTMPRLSEALDRLVHGPALARSALPLVPPPPAPPVPEPQPSPAPEPRTADLPPEPVAEAPAPPGQELDTAGPEEHERSTPFASATVDYYTTRPFVEPEEDAAPPAEDADPRTPSRGVEPPAPRPVSLVRALSACVDDLASVADTAAVVAAEARTLVPADAVAILVRDGAVWRVADGIALRPLEHRLQLDSDHWLTRQLSASANGMLLVGGEGRWAELYGAPLSDRHHLLAVPLMPVGAILLMARDESPFEEADLERLTGLCDEGGHLLADALDVRRLARQLSAFVDQVD